jgi:ribosomal protein S18 acetylase RimI-like enzyme
VTVLIPMRAEAFASYLQSSVAGYAQDNVASGRWPADGSRERSLVEFRSLLPQGLATPDNHLFEIMAHEGGPTVGYLWFAIEERHGIRCAFVYNVEIKPEFRRQGHARRAFQALEALVASMGLSSIGLHVFAHNPGAQSLYSQLGFAVTGISMLKQIGPPTIR